jgi:hypothetical protein
MFEPFVLTFRESFQCSVILALVLLYPKINDSNLYFKSFITGIVSAFIIGFPSGYIPYISKHLLNNETWTFWRYITESIIFYLSIVFVIVRLKPASFIVSTGIFFLGFFIFFFEARAVGFVIQDIGAMKENIYGTLSVGLLGTVAGFAPFIFLRKYFLKIPLQKVFILPSLLLFIGALEFGFGGVGELESQNIMIPLQQGLLNFVGEAVTSMQSILLIPAHQFMNVSLAGLAGFLAGDRTAMTITVLFLVAPPLYILIHIFARPDPLVSGIQVGAQRRQKIAFFRKDLIYQSIPVMSALVIVIVLLHAVNISLNPLYDPVPIPVRIAEDEGVLKIPLSDRSGDLTDKKLRKYVYYNGNDQIQFFAILRPDGSVGIALDECEICVPADWNKEAKGYAQRGDHLVCKYCMTPIATATVNNPGGCNPIPVNFRMDDNTIIIPVDDLISTFREVESFDKKGMHL